MASVLGTRLLAVHYHYNAGRKEGTRTLSREKEALKEELMGEACLQQVLKTVFSFLGRDLGKPFRVQSLEALPECIV